MRHLQSGCVKQRITAAPIDRGVEHIAGTVDDEADDSRAVLFFLCRLVGELLEPRKPASNGIEVVVARTGVRSVAISRAPAAFLAASAPADATLRRRIGAGC